MYVFVLDKNKQPLDPCHPAKARELLKKGRAAIYKQYPFTIIIKDRKLEHSVTHPHRVKIDPGSKVTGMTVLQENTNRCVFAAEITHRGFQIREALLSRRQLRRSRRSRKTRYRQPRFLNRTRPDRWLPPSLQSRIENVLTWVNRLRRICPITAISQELVKFDLQKLEQPEIQGVDYQRGELFGFEVKQYLLTKWKTDILSLTIML
jgi:RRXRR protein